MKKKSYQKPLMVSEEFVPQEYVAACSPDISWQPKPNATPYSSDSHFWIDKNNNGILDTNEQINSNRYTCDVSIRPRACFFPLFSFLPLWLHYNLNPLCVQY